MVKIKPFAAIRPPKQYVEEVAARPYDVLNSVEAKAEAGEKSLLHITKPEIDFGDNNEYVTVKIRAGCIGCDGKPVTNVKLEKEFELYEVN